MHYYRIGVRHIDMAMFEKGFPYVWGEGVTDWGYLDCLKDVAPGDLLVAGGTERVSFIGEVTGKPAYLFASGEGNAVRYRGKGIEEAGPDITAAFAPLENDYNDVVCIPVKWFPLDCSALRMPAQERGGIKHLNQEGIAWLERLLASGKTEREGEAGNPLLSFTAIDFETGSGFPNSVCQVGLVRVENGVMVETYSSLIKPPDNFIHEDFTRIHGITPEHTKHAPSFAESYPRWKHLVENKTLVAHNMKFDHSCLVTCLKDFFGIEKQFKTYCTMKIWKGKFENAQLATCCERTGISLINHHNALADAEACARLFMLAVNTGRDLKE
jgi:DNA polymerase-3 subunit epsilon